MSNRSLMKPVSRLVAAAALIFYFVGCVTTSALEKPAGISQPAREILQRWIEAEGGGAALQEAASYKSVSSFDYGHGQPKITVRMWRAADGKFRNEVVRNDGNTFVAAFDGRIAWHASELLGFGVMSRADLHQTLVKADMQEAMKVEQEYLSGETKPDDIRENRRCHCLQMEGKDGSVERWFFDPKSGQRVRVERAPWPGHPDGSVTVLSDFRKVGGVTIPFTIRSSEGGRVTVVTIESLVLNPDLKDVTFAATPEQLLSARKSAQILLLHEQGVGGEEAFMKLNSRVTHATLEVSGMKSRMVISQKLPGYILVDSDTTGVGHVVQGFDGNTAWVNSDLQGYRTMKGAELQQLLNNADLRGDIQLAARYPLRKWIGEKTIDGHRTEAVLLSNWQASAGTYYFDAQNGLVRRITSNLVTGAKGVLPVTVDFSDFRTVDGITLPFVTTATNPAMKMVTTIQSIENNVSLDDAIFAPQKD